jgi:hypothetical protein
VLFAASKIRLRKPRASHRGFNKLSCGRRRQSGACRARPRWETIRGMMQLEGFQAGRACQIALVSRAGFYRHHQEHEPRQADMALRRGAAYRIGRDRCGLVRQTRLLAQALSHGARLSPRAASIWRSAVGPITESVAHALWNSLDKRQRRSAPPGTRLTQRRSHEAKGTIVPEPEAPPKPQSVCRMCGTCIDEGAHYCRECRLVLASDRMAEVAPSGWVATQSTRAQALRAETQGRHGTAKRAWDPTTHPAWLNEEVYRTRVQPGLRDITVSNIASALGISWAYASNVQKGKVCPHPRHWVKLAELVGITAPV